MVIESLVVHFLDDILSLLVRHPERELLNILQETNDHYRQEAIAYIKETPGPLQQDHMDQVRKSICIPVCLSNF